MQANSYASPAARGGNREDLRDVLTILEPESFPFTSMVRKTDEAAATLGEVLGDTLRAPRISGTREGQSNGKGNNKAAKRQRFGVYQHRVMDEYGTTDVQQAISKRGGTAAVANEFAYGKAKTLRELKRDMEAICCSNQDHAGGSDAEMQTRGCFKWLQPSATASFTAPAVPAEFLPLATSATGTTTVTALKTIGAAATTANLTEDDLNYILIALQRQHGGSREYQGIFGDAIVNVVDHFTRTNSSTTNVRYQVNDNADKHEISMTVKVFQSSAGRVNILPTQFNFWDSTTNLPDPSAGLILKLDLWYLDSLEGLHAVDRDDDEDAGGVSGYAKAMFANCCKMPRGNGKITQS
jgi:hypothetical protein